MISAGWVDIYPHLRWSGPSRSATTNSYGELKQPVVYQQTTGKISWLMMWYQGEGTQSSMVDDAKDGKS